MPVGAQSHRTGECDHLHHRCHGPKEPQEIQIEADSVVFSVCSGISKKYPEHIKKTLYWHQFKFSLVLKVASVMFGGSGGTLASLALSS